MWRGGLPLLEMIAEGNAVLDRPPEIPADASTFINFFLGGYGLISIVMMFPQQILLSCAEPAVLVWKKLVNGK